ncbi:MAG: PcfJ domain-containing protein, partial [Pseudomonadales bacterium]|nr:PcfJ domain-containing protein [Pseudomonadales bacterium]
MTCTTAIFDLSQILHYQIRVEVNSWDSKHPLHWLSYNDEGPIAEGQFLEPPGLPLFTLEDDAGRRLCDALPEQVSKIAALMPAMDFELAQACATSEAARELAYDAPLLFILLVDHARKQSLSLHAFSALIAGKRSDILEAVGLPRSMSLARLVRRLTPSPLLPWELEDVHTALQNPDYLDLMRHHPHLHLNHIRLLNRIRQPLWPGLLNLVDEHTSAMNISWLCRMIRDTLAVAGRNQQVLAGISSREDLQVQHDRLVEQFNRANSRNSEEKRQDLAKELSEEHGDYPKPPLASIEGIEPLCSWLELLEEGAAMRHC